MSNNFWRSLERGAGRGLAMLLCLALTLAPLSGVALAADEEGTVAMTTLAKTELVLTAAETGLIDAVMSGNGQCIAFVSKRDLVDGTATNYERVYLYDRATKQIELISKASDGTPGDGISWHPAISFDGQYVAFVSSSTNLDPRDTADAAYLRQAEWTDVFVHDRATGQTEMVSFKPNGDVSYGNAQDRPSISADGRYVAFQIEEPGISPSDVGNLWRRDRLLGQTVPADVINGFRQNGRNPVISADGMTVAFVRSDTMTYPVLVHNLQSGTAFGATISYVTGKASAEYGSLEYPAISANGQLVAFESCATDLISGDYNGNDDIFVRPLGGPTGLASVSTNGLQANSASMAPDMSADGRFIAYKSSATNLVDYADANGYLMDAFVYDRTSGSVELVSVDEAWQQFDQSVSYVSLSDDGQLVFFYLESGDAYIHQRGVRTNLPVLGTTLLDFGEVEVGQTRTLDLTVMNDGPTDITVTSTLTDAGFAITAGELTAYTLVPGASVTLTVQFAPSVSGLAAGDLIFSTSGTPITQTVSLTGVGIEPTYPDIQVDSSSVGFGNVAVGTSSDLTLTISNVGTAPLQISGISVSGDDFSVEPELVNHTLAEQTSAVVTVRFAPLVAGTVTGQLVISSNDPDEASLTVSLSGTGIIPSGEVEATVNMSPGTFNLSSRGKNDINASIQLPAGYDVNLIAQDTIMLTINGIVTPVLPGSVLIADTNLDGILELTCKFDKATVLAAVDPAADAVALTVSGILQTGQQFKGTDTVKVLNRD